ncbi:uncharacterized protein [Montipora capricornis]|uniref:uncharacterized protein n=1 Tax=Montipora capricornis TaxID=246305 RepID=UPI0035F17460
MTRGQFEAYLLLSLTAVLLVPHQETSAIGTCSFHMYIYKTRMFCEIPFYEGLRLGFINNCSANFETLIDCIKTVTRICEHSWRSDAWIDMDVRFKFQKEFYCQNGALIFPFALCGKKYHERGPQCVQAFHRKFRNDITDPTLCEEFSNAKRCIQKLFEDECPAKKNSHSLYVDVLFDGYNPFCKDTHYTPPPEITTPRRRNVETVRFSWTSKRVLIAATENVVTTNSACREKLSWNSFLLPLIVLCRALFV